MEAASAAKLTNQNFVLSAMRVGHGDIALGPGNGDLLRAIDRGGRCRLPRGLSRCHICAAMTAALFALFCFSFISVRSLASRFARNLSAPRLN